MDPVLFEESALNALDHARRHLLKHLRGVTEEQIDWKPYPECKSIRETLSHLVVDDLAAVQSLETGREPEYGSFEAPQGTFDELLARLEETHRAVLEAVAQALRKSGSRGSICAFGEWRHPCEAVSMLASEDYYHAGQIAFIRMATQPGWDYYSSVYGD